MSLRSFASAARSTDLGARKRAGSKGKSARRPSLEMLIARFGETNGRNLGLIVLSGLPSRLLVEVLKSAAELRPKILGPWHARFRVTGSKPRFPAARLLARRGEQGSARAFRPVKAAFGGVL